MVDKSDVYFWLLFSTIFCLGVIVGVVLSYFLVLEGIKVVGTAFQVENVNVTVQLNQTMLVEAMNEAVNRSTPGNLSNIDLSDGMIK